MVAGGRKGEVTGGFAPGCIVVESLTLKKGVNVLTFTVLNGDGPAAAAARFLDRDDNPVKGLKFSLTPAPVAASRREPPVTLRAGGEGSAAPKPSRSGEGGGCLRRHPVRPPDP